MSYYECHITMMTSEDISKHDIQQVVESYQWKFSAIDGDPILGDGVKCYATMHYAAKQTVQDVIQKVKSLSKFISMHGITVIRDKVELVLYDTKQVNTEAA